MRNRSGMAAWALVAACILGIGTVSRAKAGDETVANKVDLELQISGVGPKGCDVEIKAGHGGCKFETVTKKIDSSGDPIRLEPIRIDAKSSSVDHDCSFVITLKEPGRKPRTYRRGLQLKPGAPGEPVPVQTLKCHLSSPSLAVKDESENRTRRR